MKILARKDTKMMLNKVPEVMIGFWIIKILATTMGETAADFIIFNLKFGLNGTSMIMSLLLTAILAMQLHAHAYKPWLYWSTVVLISIVGTLVSDTLVDNFGVTLELATLVFGVMLAVTFISWYRIERTLSIHTIVTKRRELFYWAAILFTFALGTSGGDLVSEGFHLGYANAALLFSGAIAIVAIAHYALKANAVATFWIAYILTRPLGASCGDLLSQSVVNGGLGFGAVITSGIFLVIIFALVVYLTIIQKRVAFCVPIPSINTNDDLLNNG